MTSVLESLNNGLHRAFAADERVHLLGEDILDPYGGAFKVSRGLSTLFPDRVLTTPISEAAITGVAAGMALRGLKPIVEIMFGDFLTLAADQLINHVAKFRWMYNDQVRVPLILRTPMGGRRGYGPTHSQTLEKIFMGIPGLRVTAPCAYRYNGPESDDCAGDLLCRLVLESQEPTLFIENKLLYLQKITSSDELLDFTMTSTVSDHADFPSPAVSLSIAGAPESQLTFAAYGYMAGIAQQAVRQLAYEHEVFCDLVIVTQLSPFDLTPILDSVRKTNRLLVMEEGSLSMGWGAEVIARTAVALGSRLIGSDRTAALDLPVPASPSLEKAVLPEVESIISQSLRLVKEK